MTPKCPPSIFCNRLDVEKAVPLLVFWVRGREYMNSETLFAIFEPQEGGRFMPFPACFKSRELNKSKAQTINLAFFSRRFS